MPVEVSELVIKAVVDDQLSAEKKKTDAGKTDKEEIITECVEQILEILKREKER